MDDASTLTEFLQGLHGAADGDVPLLGSALRLAALDHPGISLDRYDHYARELPARVRARFHDLISAGADDDTATRLAALKFVLHDEDEFKGDVDRYDDLQNADLIRVIDRRLGLPVALGILYIHAARGADMQCAGLDFPGHFLLRLEHNGQMIIFDPFDGCKVMGAPELRVLIKRVNGPGAELQADYYQAIGNRAILIRLQNNLKRRLIEDEEYTSALRVIERMRIIDPTEYRLLLDAGVLYAKVHQVPRAIECLNGYLDQLPPRHPGRYDAEMLLAEIESLES